MSKYDPQFADLTDPNDEFRRLVRASPFTRSEIAKLLKLSVPTINAYMATRRAKKWRRVDPSTIKALRHILRDQETAVEDARKRMGVA
jgi:predicted transcriptional regulator